MKWHPVKLWRIVIAIQRGTVVWWYDPRTRRNVLRSNRSGTIYDYALTRFGFAIKPRL